MLQLPDAVREAEQEAIVPPFVPTQSQFHGPFPVKLAAAPTLQRPVVGAVENVPPFAEPHAPFVMTGAFVAPQLAVAPLLAPAQLHVHGPLPETADGVPVMQRPVVGALLNCVPFDAPQDPSTAGLHTADSATVTGVEVSVVVPFPRSAKPPYPQHLTEPSPSNAQVILSPAETAVAVEIPGTIKGVVGLSVVVPFPRPPWALPPQHAMEPFESNAQS